MFHQKVVDLEWQYWNNGQYSRRECMEIAGLPADMDHVNLEAKAVEIFSNIGCDIDSEYIDAYHRIS